jgi:hypothetical protein
VGFDHIISANDRTYVQCHSVILRSGTFPLYYVSFFRSQSKKRNIDKTANTMLPQAIRRLNAAAYKEKIKTLEPWIKIGANQ